MMLDERFAPHDEGEAEHRNSPTPNAMMEGANQCAVISTSGLWALSLSRNVWRYYY
jgi:hypothetical protein